MRFLMALLAFSICANAKPAANLWSDTSTLSFRLEGDFKGLFKKAKNLVIPEGRQSANSADAFVPGSLSYQDEAGQTVKLDVDIRVRGHWTRANCPFPKLELAFKDKKALKASIFAGNKTIKIGTHCSDNSLKGDQRISWEKQNQLQAHREAFVYRMLQIWGVPSYLARQARVTYVEADGQEITRNAFVLETTDALKKRLDLKEIFPRGSDQFRAKEKEASEKGKHVKTAFESMKDHTNPTDILMVSTVENFINNDDWRFPDGNSAWNIKMYVAKDGTKLVSPLDFNLSTLVTDPKDLMTYYSFSNFGTPEGEKTQQKNEVIDRILNKRDEIMQAFEQVDFTYPDPDTGATSTDSAGQNLMRNALMRAFDEIKRFR